MAGWILRLVVVMTLLASVHPALALLALAAAPAVFTSTWRPTAEQAAQQRAAPFNRLARHLFATATTAAPAKEVRVTGIGDSLMRDRRRAWQYGHEPIAAARWTSMVWHTASWAIFGAAYVGSIVFVSAVLHAPAGSVLLVLAAGGLLSAYISATVGELGFLRGFWAYGARRLAWLEDYAASFTASADLPAPARVDRGIRFDRVSFAYPGTNTLVLERRHARSSGRHRRRDRRRERRGQEHAREAAVAHVRSDVRPDSRRRHGAVARSRRCVATAPRRRLSGFREVRAARAP